MAYAKFVARNEVVIPAYLLFELPRAGDVIEWQGRKFRVLGPPIREDKLDTVRYCFMQPVIPVEEVPADTLWLPRSL